MDRSVFGFFLFWYIIGLVLLTFDRVPWWLQWANAVFLVLSGLLAMLFFYRSHSPPIGLTMIAVIFISSMAVESIGVHTGLIFGDYTYMADFGPKLMGVPVTIGFAWVMVMGTSHALARPVAAAAPRYGGLIYAAYGALVATSMDLIIDPVAYVVKEYWVWNQGGIYYGIPLSNFFGWFALSFAMHLIIYRVYLPGRRPARRVSQFWNRRMVWLYGMVIFMFAAVAAANGLVLAAAIAVMAMTAYYALYFRLSKAPGQRRAA